LCHGQAKPARLRDARERDHLIWWCFIDRRRIGTAAIPRKLLTAEQFYLLPLVRQSLPTEPERCPVCGELALLEEHHVAPRVAFGDEADRWPTVWVCRRCHERWHERTGVGRCGRGGA